METRNYELAYLLSPSLTEGEVRTQSGKLTSLIEESKGVISRAESPKKLKLAYPIKKNTDAFFGWTSFSISPELTTELDKKLKSRQDVIRYLLVEKVSGKETFLPRTRPFFKPKPVPREAERGEEKLDLEGLDKKLEEILGK